MRIYPIYWIIATVYLFMLFCVDGKAGHIEHHMDFSSYKEWIFITKSYLLLPTEYQIFLPIAWSLRYEVLFYLIFFLFITLGLKKAKVLFVLWVVITVIMMIYSSFTGVSTIMIFNERIFQFLAGSVVGYSIRQSYDISNRVWLLLFVSSIAMFSFVYPNSLKTPYGILILAYMMGLIVYKIVRIDLGANKKYPKILLQIGEASYSIYLSHIIFLSQVFRGFQFVVKRFDIHNVIALHCIILILFSLTIAGGLLIFRFIETPVLKYFNSQVKTKRLLVNTPSAAA